MLENPKKCKVKCYNSWDIPEIMVQEDIDYSNVKPLRDKNIALFSQLTDCNSPKIPHISHHIWFTSPTNPKEIKERDLNFLRKTSSMLDSHKKWEHYLWTNDPSLIPNSINILNTSGITVKNINEVTLEIDYELTQALNDNAFGMASDIFRCAIVEKEGGIYFDMDYELYKPLDKMTCTFDSFFGMDDFSNRYFGNAVIAAKKNHPILRIGVELIKRNFLQNDKAPDYIKYPCSLFAKTITKAGPTLLTIAYYKASHQEGNIDIGLAHGTVFRLDKSFPHGFSPDAISAPYYTMHDDLVSVSLDNSIIQLTQFGNDSYSGSWIGGKYWDIIDYYIDC